MSIPQPLTVLKKELLENLVPQILELLQTALSEGRAVHQVEDGLWNDPEYLESLRRDAQKLTLNEGDAQSPLLKLVTP